MDQNAKMEALAQDCDFVKALARCATAEDVQQLFAAKEISLSEADLLQVAAGVDGLNRGYIEAQLKSIAPYSMG